MGRKTNAQTAPSLTYLSRSWTGRLAIEDVALRHAESAIATICAIMDDTDVHPQHRLSAANTLLDRAFGKVDQRLAIASLSVNSGDYEAADQLALRSMSTRDLLLMAANRYSQSNQSVTEPVQTTPGLDFEKGE